MEIKAGVTKTAKTTNLLTSKIHKVPADLTEPRKNLIKLNETYLCVERMGG
jgi:hypothetical protein